MASPGNNAAIAVPEDDFAKESEGSNPQVNAPKRSKEEYRQRLNDALASSTIMGIAQAFSKNKIIYKLFWFAVFIGGVIAFIVNFYHITKNYLKYPILTQLEPEDKNFTWPHFTFCNPANPIPFWKSKSYVDKWKTQFAKAHTYALPRYTAAGRDKKIWEHYIGIATINPKEFYGEVVNASIQSVSVVYEDTSIVGFTSPLDLFENVKDFDKVFEVRLDTIRSPIPCYTLRPEKLSEVVSALRKDHKLIAIKLYIILDAKSYKFFDMGFENRKMYFFITEANATTLSKFPHYILPGTDSTLVMNQKVHRRIADCTKEQFTVELYDLTMEKIRTFKGGFDDCRTSLSQERFVTKCGCYNPYLPIYKYPQHLNLPKRPVLCTNMSIFDNETMKDNVKCLNNVSYSEYHSSTFDKDLEKRCNVYKMNPCIETTYSVARYSATWQKTMSKQRRKSTIEGSQYLKNAPKNVTEDFPTENLAILTLQWGRQDTVATFEEYEYPFSQYMSDFGGIIGLWIGLSLISVFEIIEIVYKLQQYLRAPA